MKSVKFFIGMLLFPLCLSACTVVGPEYPYGYYEYPNTSTVVIAPVPGPYFYHYGWHRHF